MKRTLITLCGLMGMMSLCAQHLAKLNETTVQVTTAEGQHLYIDFYGENILRLFQDPQDGPMRDPVAEPQAQILVKNPRRGAHVTLVGDTIKTASLCVLADAKTGALTILKDGQKVVEQTQPTQFDRKSTSITLAQAPMDFFYGGGVQNGRFSHRGEEIQIVNTNNWVDGGVASPTPYYWSTRGYGMMWYTFRPGKYDFGKANQAETVLTHETDYLDVFFMINDGAVALLNDFYQLTGNPVLLPKFGFYEGHLNAYNRDYWKETPDGAEGAMGMVGKGGSVLFEDGKYYKESQTDNGGVKESLNGEKDNYQFSARAVIDRYLKADMPLGWVLPNDGYGAGYGQTGTLKGNIQNLKDFGDYARSKGVEIGLWTQSDLYPKEGVEPLLQRDIVKEVRDAGVRVLKTDVAWVGAGYSFGLNGVQDVGEVMPYYGKEARPFIISLDGWAGTQRYAGIWTGDQTGGEWDYIRYHIPTFIGSGLSGQPNITNDMDGIFGGKNIPVNVRDFQWKTFTPMQLNMDGWGSNPKYPQALGEPATSINRRYLKLKSALMPYTYSIAHEAVTGKPMVRAMFLEEENAYTLGTATRYQFMFGPYILVAPIYKGTRMKENGDDERDGIYLPEGEWVDNWQQTIYQGGRIINNYPASLDCLPFFYKRGAIIPMTKEHNTPNQADKAYRKYRIFPAKEKTSFTEYDDDGRTQAYLAGESTTTRISQQLDEKKRRVSITIDPMEGSYEGVTTNRTTVLEVLAANLLEKPLPMKVTAKVGGKKVTPVVEMIESDINGYLCITLPATDVRQQTEVVIDGYRVIDSDVQTRRHGVLPVPQSKGVVTEPRSLTPQWTNPESADYCEVEFDGRIYSTVRHGELLFEDLTPETEYSFRLRAVNADGKSEWSAPVTASTEADPLEHAIRGMRGELAPSLLGRAGERLADQPGQGVRNLFDFDEAKGWHTAWGTPNATPFDVIIDLRSVSTIDRMTYQPRPDAGNGTIQKGTIAWSMDKQTWHDEQPFTWARDGQPKTVNFTGGEPLRYIRLHVDEAVGGFGSGQELYVFRVPGSEWYIPGDINQDKKIDENDLTSYMNYTGLRQGDGDFEGYVSKGDLNGNGLIDAQDISAVAVELDGGVSSQPVPAVDGTLAIAADKKQYKAGEEVVLTVSGKGLRSVNALSLCLPYDATELEYVGVEASGLPQMYNMTYDRLHTSGQKALYPTFVNLGEKPAVEGDADLLTVRFRAKKNITFTPTMTDAILVDKRCNAHHQ